MMAQVNDAEPLRGARGYTSAHIAEDESLATSWVGFQTGNDLVVYRSPIYGRRKNETISIYLRDEVDWSYGFMQDFFILSLCSMELTREDMLQSAEARFA
jgi:hypothetical protein